MSSIEAVLGAGATWAGPLALVLTVVGLRWLRKLQHRQNEHAERIAHLEGRLDVDRKAGSDDGDE